MYSEDGYDEMESFEYEEEIEYSDIDPGRIRGIRRGDQGKKAIELVSMPYPFLADPNPHPVPSGEMGPAPKDPHAKFAWSQFLGWWTT